MSIVRAGTGCSGRGAEWAPPSEATSWTSSTTRTRPWTTSWVCTRRRRATTGAHPTSPNIPTSSTRWRSTTDRYGPALVSLCLVDTFFSVFDLNSVVTVQDEEAVKMLTATAGTNSKLAKPIQDLIKMIFDVESMKKAMVEFEVGFALVAQTKRVIQSSSNELFFSIRNFILAFFPFRSSSDRPPEDAPWKTEQEADSECLCSAYRSTAGKQPVATLFFSLLLPRSGTLGCHRSSFFRHRPCQMPRLTPTSWTCPIASTR